MTAVIDEVLDAVTLGFRLGDATGFQRAYSTGSSAQAMASLLACTGAGAGDGDGDDDA